jgi:hypothetical protein
MSNLVQKMLGYINSVDAKKLSLLLFAICVIFDEFPPYG